MRLTLTRAVSGALILFSVCLAAARAEPAAPPATKPADAAPDYRAIDGLKGRGFKKCAGDASRLIKFIYDSDDFAYLNFWHTSSPDGHSALTVTAKPYSDGPSMTALTTSPTADGTCDATLVQMFVVADSCAKLRETSFKDWKYYTSLGDAPLYEDPTTPSVVVALVPSQGSCMIVKTGILFFPADQN